MEPSGKLKDALRALDWRLVEQYLSAPTEVARADRLRAVLQTALREGAFIVRHPQPNRIALRDGFVDSLEKYTSEVGEADLVSQLRSGRDQARLIESLYHAVMQRVDRLIGTKDSPAAIARSCLKLAHEEFLKWRAAAQERLEAAGKQLDVFSLRLRPDESLPLRAPDDIVYAIDVTLRHQLLLLAFQNGWFDGQAIVIPSHSTPTTPDPSDTIAPALRNLAAIWYQLERSDTACRLFEGQVERMTLNVPFETVTRSVPTIKFAFPMMWNLAIDVAGERLRRHVSARRNANASELPDDARIPRRLSEHEAQARGLMFELTGLNVATDNERPGGLLLWEWIRGYAVLEALAHGHLQGAGRSELCIAPESAFQAALIAHEMTPAAASTFIRQASLGRTSVDLHDCPLIRLGDDRICLWMFASASQSAARLTLSQCARLAHQLSSKGSALENEVRELFRRRNIPAFGLKKRVEGEELEIDCLVLWERRLFVLECKNYALPGESVPNQYSFFVNQEAAAAQVLRIVSILARHPELVHQVFGANVAWDQVVPVVLNGLPFSLPGLFAGAYFCDRMSLRAFLDYGKIRCFRPGAAQAADVPQAGEDLPLWSGDAPSAEDFLAHLQENKFFQLTAEQFKPSWIPVPIAPELAMITTMMGRGESVYDELLELARAQARRPHLPDRNS
jgi:hypothetical protein